MWTEWSFDHLSVVRTECFGPFESEADAKAEALRWRRRDPVAYFARGWRDPRFSVHEVKAPASTGGDGR